MKKKLFIPVTILFFAFILVFAYSINPPKTSIRKTTDNAPKQEVTKPSDYYYPMTDFASRIKIKSFGTYVKTGDEKKEMCGRAFTGYHTGDDLEVTSAELNQVVPVKAVAVGRVLMAGSVSGYGGLVVIEHVIDGQTVTAYYGHLNIHSVSLKKGQTVQAGQAIGDLGKACSSETDYERKHLHFAIHKGVATDVRGYVQKVNELGNWLDPLKLLEIAKAT